MNKHIFETTKRNVIEMLEKAELAHYYNELLETYQSLSNAIDDYIKSNNLDDVSDEKEIKVNFKFLRDYMYHDQATLVDFDKFVERVLNSSRIERVGENISTVLNLLNWKTFVLGEYENRESRGI